METNKQLREFTLRSFILAIILTMLFTSTNVYLGLKAGLTFSTAIPAAVISMALFRLFKNTTIYENMTVQTIASAAGTISSIVFVLPGLIMLGVWQQIPFWQTACLASIGGILGVMLTIPLRRALVVNSNLPYPEGTAAAEVIRIGCQSAVTTTGKDSAGVKQLLLGSLTGALYQLCSNGFKLLGANYSYFTTLGRAVVGGGFQMSFALMGVGYIVGVEVGLALLLGIIIAWGVFVPYFSMNQIIVNHDLMTAAITVWQQDVRSIGVGAIAIAALWSIVVLAKPVVFGIKDALIYSKQKRLGVVVPRQEQDLPIHSVWWVSMILMFPLMALYTYFFFTLDTPLGFGVWFTLILVGVFMTMIIGILVAATSGYMSGLVGSSYSPISGIGVLAVLIISFFFLFLKKHGFFATGISDHRLDYYLSALTLFMGSAVMGIASISNDNLQDLKTAHLIGATPWRQQIALIIGVLAGSIMVPITLNLLANTYGFVGQPGADPATALQAPQASALYTITQGVLAQNLDWSKLMIGVLIGIFILLVDQIFFKPRKKSFSAFAVGLGVYLPVFITLMIFIGTLLAFFVGRFLKHSNVSTAIKENIEKRGTLLAAGLIVGDAVMGVIFAGLIGVTHKDNPLALMNDQFQGTANILGLIVFAFICIWSYKHITSAKTA